MYLPKRKLQHKHNRIIVSYGLEKKKLEHGKFQVRTFKSRSIRNIIRKRFSINTRKHVMVEDEDMRDSAQPIRTLFLLSFFWSCTHISLDNVANSLTALQYGNKFVECRVQDDDETSTATSGGGNEGKDNGVTENGKPNSKEILSAFLDNNLKVLRNCHEKFSLDIDDSDEDEAGKAEKTCIFQPINPYNERPLPHIFGSKEWHEKWHVGLSYDQQDNYYSGDEISEAFSDSTSSGAADNDSYESRSECASSFSASNDNFGGNFEVRNATTFAHSKVRNADPVSESSSTHSSMAKTSSYFPQSIGVEGSHTRSESLSSANSKTESYHVKTKPSSVGKPALFKSNIPPYADLFAETEPPDDLGSTTTSTPSIGSSISRKPVNLFNDDDDEVYKHLVIAGSKRKDPMVVVSPKTHNIEKDKAVLPKPLQTPEPASLSNTSTSVFPKVDEGLFNASSRPSPSSISKTPKNLFDDDFDEDDDFLSAFVKKQKFHETTKTLPTSSSTIHDRNIYKENRSNNNKNIFDDKNRHQTAVNLFDDSEEVNSPAFDKQQDIPKPHELFKDDRKIERESSVTKQSISNILKSNLFDDNDTDDDDFFKTKPSTISISTRPDYIKASQESTNEIKHHNVSPLKNSTSKTIITENGEVPFGSSSNSKSLVTNDFTGNSSSLLNRNTTNLYDDVEDENMLLPTKETKDHSSKEKQMPPQMILGSVEVLPEPFSNKIISSRERIDSKSSEEKQMIPGSIEILKNIFEDEETETFTNKFISSSEKIDSKLPSDRFAKEKEIAPKMIPGSVEILKNIFENEETETFSNKFISSSEKIDGKSSEGNDIASKIIPDSVEILKNIFEDEETETFTKKLVSSSPNSDSMRSIESNRPEMQSTFSEEGKVLDVCDKSSLSNSIVSEGKLDDIVELETETTTVMNEFKINEDNKSKPISVEENIEEIPGDQNPILDQISSEQNENASRQESIAASEYNIPKQNDDVESVSKIYDFNSSLIFDEPPDDNDFFENLGKSAQNTNMKYNSFDLENELYPEPDLPKMPTVEQSLEYKGLQLFSDIPPDDNDFGDATSQKPEYTVFYDDFSETLEALGRNHDQVTSSQHVEYTNEVNASDCNKDIVDHQVKYQMIETEVNKASNSSTNRPISRLKMPNININVQALLPTANITVQKRKAEEPEKFLAIHHPTSTVENVSDQTPIQTVQKQKNNDFEKTFEAQESTSSKESVNVRTSETEHILPSINKNRIRAPVNRRPSTRRARQENYRKSLLEEDRINNESEKGLKDDEETSVRSKDEFLPIEDNKQSAERNKIGDKPKTLIPVKDNLLKTTKESQVIAQLQKTSPVSDQKDKSNFFKNTTKSLNTFFDDAEDEDNDDLFRSIITKKPEKKPIEKSAVHHRDSNTDKTARVTNEMPGSTTPSNKDHRKPVAGLLSSGISEKLPSNRSTPRNDVNSSYKKIFENSSESDDDLFATLGSSQKAAMNAKKDTYTVVGKTPLEPPKINSSKPKPTATVEKTTASGFAKVHVTKKQPSLFSDDSDDDDFLKTSAKKLITDSSKPKASSTTRSGSIFSDIDTDDDDDLFDANRKATKNNRMQRDPAPVTAESKKPTKQTVEDNPLADLL